MNNNGARNTSFDPWFWYKYACILYPDDLWPIKSSFIHNNIITIGRYDFSHISGPAALLDHYYTSLLQPSVTHRSRPQTMCHRTRTHTPRTRPCAVCVEWKWFIGRRWLTTRCVRWTLCRRGLRRRYCYYDGIY